MYHYQCVNTFLICIFDILDMYIAPMVGIGRLAIGFCNYAVMYSIGQPRWTHHPRSDSLCESSIVVAHTLVARI